MLYCAFIASCTSNTIRHFLKVNVSGVHAEYLLSEDAATKKTVAAKTTKVMDSPPLLG